MFLCFVTEMFEISPYAEFALGFRTFEHVENQDLPMPSRLPSRPRFDTGLSSFILVKVGTDQGYGL